MNPMFFLVEVKAYTEYAHSVSILSGPFFSHEKAVKAFNDYAKDYEECEDVTIDRCDSPHILIDDGDFRRTILIAEQ